MVLSLGRLFILSLIVLVFCACGTGPSSSPFSGLTFVAFETLGDEAKSRVDWYKDIAKDIEDFDEFAERRYGVYGETAINALKSLNDSFLSLLVDPGLSLRVEDFVEYVEKNELEQSDPWEARARFSKELGSDTIYRGLKLTLDEFETIRTKGIESEFLRKDSTFENYSRQSLAIEILHRALFVVQISGYEYFDPLMSVTEDIETAICVSRTQKNTSLKSREVYIFEINIPQIANFTTIKNSKICNYSQRRNESLPYLADAARVRQIICEKLLPSKNIESFVSLTIHPDEITGYVSPADNSSTKESCIAYGERHRESRNGRSQIVRELVSDLEKEE